MTQTNDPLPGDLSGTADERAAQLSALDPEALTAQWLHRQLRSALSAWAEDETEIDIDVEARADY